MRNTKKYINKTVVPFALKAVRYIEYSFWELLKLTGLAFAVLYFVDAMPAVEYVLAGIVVFASFIRSRKLG